MRTMVRTMVAVALLGSAGLAHSVAGCSRWGCGQNSPLVDGAGTSAGVAAVAAPASIAAPRSATSRKSAPARPPAPGVNLNSPVVDGASIATRGRARPPGPGSNLNSPLVDGASLESALGRMLSAR